MGWPSTSEKLNQQTSALVEHKTVRGTKIVKRRSQRGRSGKHGFSGSRGNKTTEGREVPCGADHVQIMVKKKGVECWGHKGTNLNQVYQNGPKRECSINLEEGDQRQQNKRG